jgi:hypothetical protein
MSDEQRRVEAFAYSVLDTTLPSIRLTLSGFYQLSEKEVEAFEDVLCTWFRRLTKRIGRAADPLILREQLLFVACKYARAFQLAKARRGEPSGKGLALALARSPEEIAWEISTRLQRSL